MRRDRWLLVKYGISPNKSSQNTTEMAKRGKKKVKELEEGKKLKDRREKANTEIFKGSHECQAPFEPGYTELKRGSLAQPHASQWKRCVYLSSPLKWGTPHRVHSTSLKSLVKAGLQLVRFTGRCWGTGSCCRNQRNFLRELSGPRKGPSGSEEEPRWSLCLNICHQEWVAMPPLLMLTDFQALQTLYESL